MKVGKGVFVYLGLLAYSVCAGQNVADSIVNVPYSIGRANTELLKDNNSVMIQDALIGTMPGVRVVQSSGDPNSNPQIFIRGRSSYYYSNDPLYVLDGVIIDDPDLLNNPNNMGFLNPDDIASITVLKDAAATSVYGSRGLNGVILLTSKKGTKDIKVNYSGNFSISIARRVDVLTGDELRDIWDKIPKNASEKAGYLYPSKDNYNYQDLIYQAAFGTKNTVSVSGNISSIHTPFRVSLGIVNQNGVIKTNLYQRYNALVSLSPSLLQDHLKINANFRASHEKSQHVDETVVYSAIFMDPTRSPYDESGISDVGYGIRIVRDENNKITRSQNYNPVSQIQDEHFENKTNRYLGNISVNYKIHSIEALSININGAFDIIKNKYDAGYKENSQYSFCRTSGSGEVTEYSHNKNNYYLDANLAYNKTFKREHTLGLQIGYYSQQFNWDKEYSRHSISKEDNEDRYIYYYWYKYPEMSYDFNNFYSRINYNYKERYFITGSVMREKKKNISSMGEMFSYKVYPSVGVAWIISNESYLKDISAIKHIKLRGSYSKSPENNTFSSAVILSTNVFNEDAVVESFDLGLDFGLIGGRLNGSINYYTKNVYDCVYPFQFKDKNNSVTAIIPGSPFSLMQEGLEIAINGILVQRNNFNWNIGANFTWQSSKIDLNMNEGSNPFFYENNNMYDCPTVMVDGSTPHIFFVSPIKYDEKGMPLETNQHDYIRTDKSPVPNIFVGLNTSINYYNWDFSLSGHGAFGKYLYNQVDAKGLKYVKSYTYEVRNITQNIADKGWMLNGYYMADEFLQNASFFKIDNITLGYTFKNLWSGNSSLRASFNAHNIATITSYKGLDPEITSASDYAGYRIPRSYSISLNLNF